MKILAVDSSGLVASVAIIEDDAMIAEYTINYKKTHSQTLLPMLDEIKKMTELDLGSIDAIAVAAGPGSFTGLRIGSATAKGLGMALNIPIIPVPTVDALAYNLWDCDKVICPIMDARREQVYTGLYSFENGVFNTIMEQTPLSVSQLMDVINQNGRDVIFLGDGVPVYKDSIEEKAQVKVCFAPAHMSRQRAGALGVLGMELYRSGVHETAADHKPVYLRQSQAEREMSEGKLSAKS